MTDIKFQNYNTHGMSTGEITELMWKGRMSGIGSDSIAFLRQTNRGLSRRPCSCENECNGH